MLDNTDFVFRLIVALTEAFTALGGDEWESRKNAEASTKRVAVNNNTEDCEIEDEIIFSNTFSVLKLSDANGANAEEDEDDGEQSNVPNSVSTTARAKKSPGKGYVDLRVSPI